MTCGRLKYVIKVNHVDVHLCFGGQSSIMGDIRGSCYNIHISFAGHDVPRQYGLWGHLQIFGGECPISPPYFEAWITILILLMCVNPTSCGTYGVFPIIVKSKSTYSH